MGGGGGKNGPNLGPMPQWGSPMPKKNRKVLTKAKYWNLRRGWVQNNKPSTERVSIFTNTIYM